MHDLTPETMQQEPKIEYVEQVQMKETTNIIVDDFVIDENLEQRFPINDVEQMETDTITTIPMNDSPVEEHPEQHLLIKDVEQMETDTITTIPMNDFPIEEHLEQSLPKNNTKTLRAEMFSLTHMLYEEYANGFSWKDYPKIIDDCINYLTPYLHMMTPLEKREIIMTALNYTIVQIDPDCLPKETFEPIFNSLIIPFIDLALEIKFEQFNFYLTNKTGWISITPKEYANISQFIQYIDELTENIQNFLKKLKNPSIDQLRENSNVICQSSFFKTIPLDWNDFADMMRLAIVCSIAFEDLPEDMFKQEIAYVFHTITETDDPSLFPEDFNKEVFCAFIDSFLEIMKLPKTKNLEILN